MVGDGVSEELSRVKVGKGAVSTIASRRQEEQREWRERSLEERKALPLPRRHLPEGALGVECEQHGLVSRRRGRIRRMFATISNVQVTANITHWGIAPSTGACYRGGAVQGGGPLDLLGARRRDTRHGGG
jgi:hypothetical protein